MRLTLSSRAKSRDLAPQLHPKPHPHAVILGTAKDLLFLPITSNSHLLTPKFFIAFALSSAPHLPTPPPYCHQKNFSAEKRCAFVILNSRRLVNGFTSTQL